ncbi:MAG: response regulator transcription factor [Actinobacteria bacterium]|nr:response regulator transcription factor [Actinomycetota bacterium]
MRVLIADDHRLIAEGIKRALDAEEDFEVVAEASTGSQILPLVRRTNPDLVLLDLRMPGLDGLSALEQIKRDHPSIKVVILSASTEPAVIQSALERGASAYVIKSVNPVDLPSTLRQAMDGTVFHAVGLPPKGLPSGATELGLTPREIGIIQALARGLSNQAIGKELFVAEQTVKFHLTNIYRKLDAANRTEAVRLAYQRGIIENPLYED